MLYLSVFVLGKTRLDGSLSHRATVENQPNK